MAVDVLQIVRLMCRISDERLDEELQLYINAARADMLRVGIREEVVNDTDNALVVTAISVYCKSHLGMDNDDAPRFDATYRQIVCDLMNSQANSSAGDSGE